MKSIALITALHAAGALGDGTGLIGLGKTLYHPTCAFACRSVIKGCKLLCTPVDSTANHGTHHNPVPTPPDCFVTDAAFLKTMAICLDTYCPISDRPDLTLLEDYWASHLGTGTLGNHVYVPALSYADALAAARRDEERVGASANTTTEGHDNHPNGTDHSSHVKKRQFMTEAGPEVASVLPVIKSGQPLNVTSFVAPEDWQKQYNGHLDFELNENGHSIYSLAIFLVAILLPIPLSLHRFVPGLANSRLWNALQSALINPPAFGKRHREPVGHAAGLVPTRGQALYISFISLLNLFFLYPEWRASSTSGNYSQYIYPCAGAPPGVAGSNRTEWPLTGSSLRLNISHEWDYHFYNFGLGGNVTNFNISLAHGLVNVTAGGCSVCQSWS